MEIIFDLIPRLSTHSQQAVKALIRQLCENEGINPPSESAPALQASEEGIPLWQASLVCQSYSTSSIRLYTHYVRRLLDQYPVPTPLSIEKHLSEQLLRRASATAVKNELKARASPAIWCSCTRVMCHVSQPMLLESGWGCSFKSS